MNYRSRNVLIIGSGSGLGQEIVEKFSNNNDHVLGTLHINNLNLKFADNISYLELDLEKISSFDEYRDSIQLKLTLIDVVIFVSGILPGKNISDYNDLLINKVMSVNFIGQAALMQRIIPLMSFNSVVIFISSISAERGSYDAIYAASKAAQIGFVKSLATWYSPKIRFNIITPGLIEDTKMYDDMSLERRKFHISQTPTGRLNSKVEIANIIYNLCESFWSNINGQVIRINGGSYV